MLSNSNSKIKSLLITHETSKFKQTSKAFDLTPTNNK